MAERNTIRTPESLVAAALATGTPRSLEYRIGMVDVLNFRMCHIPIHCPYKAGSAAFDAYMSGNDRGHALWRSLGEEARQPANEHDGAVHAVKPRNHSRGEVHRG